jgi:hypothetical protein
MAELKTKKTVNSVDDFLNNVDDPGKKKDCFEIIEIMKEVTGENPKMWGNSIVGFGDYHYKYASGTEGDWFKTGFSPRKQNLTLYIMSGFDEYENLMERLGKYKIGKSCLYIKKLSDIDLNILKELISRSLLMLDNLYGKKEN